VTDSPLPYRNPALPAASRAADLVGRLTLAEKIHLIPQYQAAVPRLGIAAYKHGTEAAHGIAWLGKATTYPQPIGLAATWHPPLLEEVGRAVALEARAFFEQNPEVNGLTLWTPTVDLERDPRWGRTEEGWGEDPVLTGHLAGSFVRGLQGPDPEHLTAVATLKHFWGNNQELDRGTASTDVDEVQQRDEYLRPFEIAFRKYGAQSMMTSYNSVNGRPANLNPQLGDIVRREWGWEGFVVSDAGDVTGTVREHHWCPTQAQAFGASLRAGIDSITDDTATVVKEVEAALEQGYCTEADLDAALRRTFRVRILLGEFDAPRPPVGPQVIASEAHGRLSRRATAASAVLLKNDGFLPLADPASLAVVGPLADEVFRDWYSGSLPSSVSPLQGLTGRFPRAVVRTASGNDRVALPWGDFEVFDWGWGSFTLKHLPTGRWLADTDAGPRADSAEIFGWFTKEVFGVHPLGKGQAALTTWNGTPLVKTAGGWRALAEDQAREGRIGIDASAPGAVDPAFVRRTATPLPWTVVTPGTEAAVAAARKADAAVVVVGSHPLVTAKETLDRPDITLPPAQEALIQAVTAVNPNTVVVVVSGYPLTSPSDWAGARAVLWVTHAGQELGHAVADLLSGDANPAGRTPMTWYRSVDDLPPLMDYDLTQGRTYRYFTGPVQFPFGHGLSYTSFTYRDLSVNRRGEVSFTLTNTGPRDGDEVVQVYLRPVDPIQPGPRQKLAAFDRLTLAAGESRRVNLTIDPDEFQVWSPSAGRRVMAASRFDVAVGASSADLRLSAVLDLPAVPRR